MRCAHSRIARRAASGRLRPTSVPWNLPQRFRVERPSGGLRLFISAPYEHASGTGRMRSAMKAFWVASSKPSRTKRWAGK